MQNDKNPFERLWKTQTSVNQLVLAGKRDPEKVANIFQAIIEGSVEFTLDRKSVLAAEPPLDTIIRVDRSVRLAYPDWVKGVIHPELEAVGPTEYDLAKQVELYLFGKQNRGGSETGHDIYKHLKETDSLKNCLSLADAVAIQSKGIAVFRKLFGNKAVFCWKSVVRDRDGSLDVPCVCDDGDTMVVYWDWLGDEWNSNSPAARFASS